MNSSHDTELVINRAILHPLNPCFTICTALSASLLLEGGYGDDLQCLTPLLNRKSWNSALVKQESLSLTKIAGNPMSSNKVFKCCIVAFEVDVNIGKVSIHLNPTSMIIRNM